ncbi:MAG: hypothetical protein EA360_09475 [Balneolaceae bacterium]|nr:MAG: hypothetical protein EA360_09475 [Balneolaceae bacterium]
MIFWLLLHQGKSNKAKSLLLLTPIIKAKVTKRIKIREDPTEKALIPWNLLHQGKSKKKIPFAACSSQSRTLGAFPFFSFYLP